jgi:hypothetical protein
LPGRLAEVLDKEQQQVLQYILMKFDDIVLAEHFDSLVLQQIRRMERCDVDAALDQLKYKSREKMETVRFMPAYLASFFRTAVGQG